MDPADIKIEFHITTKMRILYAENLDQLEHLVNEFADSYNVRNIDIKFLESVISASEKMKNKQKWAAFVSYLDRFSR